MESDWKKILSYLFFFLSVLTVFLSLFFAKGRHIHFFIGILLFLCWQRIRIRRIAARFLKRPPLLIQFLVINFSWVLLFQIFLGSSRFYQRPALALLINLGFYLPCFFIWYKIFLTRQLAFFEAFYLAGLAGIIFSAFISGKLVKTIIYAPSLANGIMFMLLKAAATLVTFGALFSFPWIIFAADTRGSAKKEKVYLLAIGSSLLVLPFFLLWLAFLKRVVFRIWL